MEMACESITSAPSEATTLTVAEIGCHLWTLQMHCYRPVPHLHSLPVHAELLLSNPQNIYIAFGRQWKFTPEFYLISTGTSVSSSVSSTILLLPLSGSSSTRSIWLCSTTISPQFNLNPLPPVLLRTFHSHILLNLHQPKH